MLKNYSILTSKCKITYRIRGMLESRYYQIEAVKAVSMAFKEKRNDWILVDLPTGSGKSIVIYMLCHGMFKSVCRVS